MAKGVVVSGVRLRERKNGRGGLKDKDGGFRERGNLGEKEREGSAIVVVMV